MDKLGIETKLIIAQLVNFTVIMLVLNKLLYKPILSMLEKRKKKIQEGLALTESLKVEAEKLDLKKEKILAETRKDAGAIIDEAKGNAKNEAKLIVEAAHKEADEIVEKGKEQAAEQKKLMMKEMQQESIELATGMAKRLLSSVMTQETQHALLKKHIKELQEIA